VMDNNKNPSVEIEIMPVKYGELEELANLAARAFSDAFGHTVSPDDLAHDIAQNRSVTYFDRAMRSGKILVAKYEGKIVGYAQYGSVKIPEANAAYDDRELGRLYVDTDLHGRGIGRQLIDAVLVDPEVAKAPNVYLQVLGENKRAIALYESYGFEKCG